MDTGQTLEQRPEPDPAGQTPDQDQEEVGGQGLDQGQGQTLVQRPEPDTAGQTPDPDQEKIGGQGLDQDQGQTMDAGQRLEQDRPADQGTSTPVSTKVKRWEDLMKRNKGQSNNETRQGQGQQGHNGPVAPRKRGRPRKVHQG